MTPTPPPRLDHAQPPAEPHWVPLDDDAALVPSHSSTTDSPPSPADFQRTPKGWGLHTRRSQDGRLRDEVAPAPRPSVAALHYAGVPWSEESPR